MDKFRKAAFYLALIFLGVMLGGLLFSESTSEPRESVTTLPPCTELPCDDGKPATMIPATRMTGVAIPVESAIIPPVPLDQQIADLRERVSKVEARLELLERKLAEQDKKK